MAALEPSAINGTSDRERIEALHTGVQALTSLFEGFSTRTAEDAALHWQLSGELKARLDNQDQMLQTLVDQSAIQQGMLDHQAQMLDHQAQMLDHHAQMLQTLVDQSAGGRERRQ